MRFFVTFFFLTLASLAFLSSASSSSIAARASSRYKEIGVRKVLGASTGSLVILLSKDFTKWVLLANIIAWPLSYYFLDKRLENFAYRIDIGIGSFILTGVLALFIALLTVLYQSISAATANPVDSIKYE